MKWYVVIKQSDSWQWWNIFTGRKHAHVFAFREVSGGALLVVDPLLSGLYCDIVMGNAIDEVRRQKEAGREVIKVECDVLAAPVRRFGLYTCVTVIKSLICCKAWWVITPSQLKEYYDVRSCEGNFWRRRRAEKSS